jgi:hypothetical protein
MGDGVALIFMGISATPLFNCYRLPTVISVKRTIRSCASSSSLTLLGNFESIVPVISRLLQESCNVAFATLIDLAG